MQHLVWLNIYIYMCVDTGGKEYLKNVNILFLFS